MRCRAGMLGANREKLFNIDGARFVATLTTGINQQPTGLFFKPDGTAMFVDSESSDVVREYSLSTPWSIASASFVKSKGTGHLSYGIAFSSTGNSFFTVEVVDGDVKQYDMSTPWDIASASLSQSFATGAIGVRQGICFSEAGDEMYVAAKYNSIVQYSLSTSWDISTATYTRTLVVGANQSGVHGVHFSPDGNRMYINGSAQDQVSQYQLATPWDISTATHARNFSTAAQETFASGIFMRGTGESFYITGHATTNLQAMVNSVHEYALI